MADVSTKEFYLKNRCPESRVSDLRIITFSSNFTFISALAHLCSNMLCNDFCIDLDLSCEKGASTWLTVLPIQDHSFILSPCTRVHSLMLCA